MMNGMWISANIMETMLIDKESGVTALRVAMASVKRRMKWITQRY
jgi:hypothetical protein